jgi:ferredoxin-NADP reductase
MKYIDNFLNRVTMYRLLIYVLMGMLTITVVLASVGLIHYSPLSLVLSTIYITFFCWITNVVFAKVFRAPINVESVYITALILMFLITPIQSFSDTNFYILGFWASVWAIASKFIFAIKKKHVFNPAAFGVAIPALFLGYSASWWIGTTYLIVPAIISTFLITKKIRRFDLVGSFILTACLVILIPHITGGASGILKVLQSLFLSAPILFFAGVMLTEPLTTPPTKSLQIFYGILVGVLFSPDIHIGSFYFTPEFALLTGNIFSYIVSPKEKLLLILKERINIAQDTYDFVFTKNEPFRFVPGQYLEWTLAHTTPDNRGNRRYFTIASSPTEETVRMGVKFYPEPSSFKKSLLSLSPGQTIIASQRAGDFTLPKDTKKKLVFISGGIGITPFRSILKYLIDTHQKRDIVHFYSNKALPDIAYKDILDMAERELGIKTVYTLTEKNTIPPEWHGESGFIDKDMIVRHLPDFKERTFYLSGPHIMVTTFETLLKSMGVKKSQIITDFFPGFA